MLVLFKVLIDRPFVLFFFRDDTRPYGRERKQIASWRVAGGSDSESARCLLHPDAFKSFHCVSIQPPRNRRRRKEQAPIIGPELIRWPTDLHLSLSLSPSLSIFHVGQKKRRKKQRKPPEYFFRLFVTGDRRKGFTRT